LKEREYTIWGKEVVKTGAVRLVGCEDWGGRNPMMSKREGSQPDPGDQNTTPPVSSTKMVSLTDKTRKNWGAGHANGQAEWLPRWGCISVGGCGEGVERVRGLILRRGGEDNNKK